MHGIACSLICTVRWKAARQDDMTGLSHPLVAGISVGCSGKTRVAALSHRSSLAEMSMPQLRSLIVHQSTFLTVPLPSDSLS